MSVEGGQVVQRTDWTVTADHMVAGDGFDGYADPASSEVRYPSWLEPQGLNRYPWSWGVVAVDVDADGWSDVAFTGNNCAAPMDIIWDESHGAGPGGLFLNNGNGGFRDVIWEANIPIQLPLPRSGIVRGG